MCIIDHTEVVAQLSLSCSWSCLCKVYLNCFSGCSRPSPARDHLLWLCPHGFVFLILRRQLRSKCLEWWYSSLWRQPTHAHTHSREEDLLFSDVAFESSFPPGLPGFKYSPEKCPNIDFYSHHIGWHLLLLSNPFQRWPCAEIEEGDSWQTPQVCVNFLTRF